MREFTLQEDDDYSTSLTDRAVITRVFPNLAALPEDTFFEAFREYRPTWGVVDIQIFWKDSAGKKWRLDAEYDIDLFEGVELMPHQVRLKHIGSAKSVFNCFAGDRE